MALTQQERRRIVQKVVEDLNVSFGPLGMTFSYETPRQRWAAAYYDRRVAQLVNVWDDSPAEAASAALGWVGFQTESLLNASARSLNWAADYRRHAGNLDAARNAVGDARRRRLGCCLSGEGSYRRTYLPGLYEAQRAERKVWETWEVV